MTSPKAMQRPPTVEYATKAYVDEQMNKLRRELSRTSVTQSSVNASVSGLAARIYSDIPKLVGQGVRAALKEVGVSDAIAAGVAVKIEEFSKAVASEHVAIERNHLRQLKTELANP